jgi:hypothetical protein
MNKSHGSSLVFQTTPRLPLVAGGGKVLLQRIFFLDWANPGFGSGFAKTSRPRNQEPAEVPVRGPIPAVQTLFGQCVAGPGTDEVALPRQGQSLADFQGSGGNRIVRSSSWHSWSNPVRDGRKKELLHGDPFSADEEHPCRFERIRERGEAGLALSSATALHFDRGDCAADPEVEIHSRRPSHR